ncbi:MAG: hypothetical protein Roseis3KO_49260 [Roseivirga sp.]
MENWLLRLNSTVNIYFNITQPQPRINIGADIILTVYKKTTFRASKFFKKRIIANEKEKHTYTERKLKPKK